ncbi:cystatin-B-like [Pseudophryne corroboree]|uniref:cystatin-B-like n=1 Tax=Pseudophryne corroboree TaxID=495146 RepID=UPI0030816922
MAAHGRVGGLGAAKPADAEVQKLCDEVRSELEKKVGKKFSTFKAETYKTQTVSGTNYFIRIKMGDNEYIDIRVYEALPQANKKPELSGYQCVKTKDSDIEYF